MEHSQKSLLIVRPPEKPIKTYQRPNKAVLPKEKKADRPSVIILDNNKSTESQENGEEHTHDLSVHSVPPEMLVINIEEVMSTTFFDPELLNAVKDRSINTTFKTKPRTPEASAKSNEASAKPADSEFPEDPLRLDVPSPAERESVNIGMGQNPQKSEDVLIESEKTEMVRKKPKLAEGVISKRPAKPVLIKKIRAKSETGSRIPTISQVVSLKTPATPVVIQKILSKSETGSPTISEVVSLETPAKPVVIKKMLSKSEGESTIPTISEVVSLKTPAKPVVIQKILSKSEGGSTIPRISDVVSLKTPAKPVIIQKILSKSEAGSTIPTISEVVSLKTPAKPVVIQKILSKSEAGSTSPTISEVVSLKTPTKPVVFKKILVKSEAGSASPPISDGVIPKVGARPVVIQEASAQPEAESAVPTTSEGASLKTPSKPVMIQKVILKSDAVQASPNTPGTSSVPQRILVNPEVSAVRIVKPTANLQVLEGGNSEVAQRVSVPPDTVKQLTKSESPSKPKTSEEVLAKISKREGAKKSKLLKPSLVKAKGAKKPDILKVAIVKKGPKGTKPKITLVKSQAVIRGMLGLDKRSKTLLAMNARHQSVTKSPEVSPTEDSSQYESLFDDDDESDDASMSTIQFPFLQPIPLPAIDDEPTGPVDAINELKEHLTPLLPRRWTLRVEDTAITAFLFAPGPKCVAQRAVCAPYDGTRLKLIIHAKEIPYDHGAYQFRLMRPSVPLTKDTVEEFARGIMGAVHSLVQQNVCVGLDEKQFVEDWWKYKDCRLDENLFDEEDYTVSLRPLQCSYLSRRKSSRKCPECSAYMSKIKSRDKRRADRQVGAVLVKKAKQILKKSPKNSK